MNIWAPIRVLGYGLLAVATFEVAARAEDYIRHGAPLFGTYSIDTVFRPGPFGKEGKPGARYLKWSMNSLGYRGPEPKPGRTNIVTYGSSETFGLYESPNHEYPRQLENFLNARRPGAYNVINIAIPGEYLGNYRYLERAMQQLKPSYVVIYPSPALAIGGTAPSCNRSQRPQPPSRPQIGDWFRLPGRLGPYVKKNEPAPVLKLSYDFSIWRATHATHVMQQVPDVSIAAYRSDILCIVRTVKAHGAKAILATHATYFGDHVQPGDDLMLASWRKFFPTLAEPGFLDLERRANAAEIDAARASGATLVRPDVAIPRGPANFADFAHFTDHGAALLADQVGAAILTDSQAHGPA
jgi:hypothetical protein